MINPPPILVDEEQNPHLIDTGKVTQSKTGTPSAKPRRRRRNPLFGWSVFFTILLAISTILLAKPDLRGYLASKLPIVNVATSTITPTNIFPTQPSPVFTATELIIPVAPAGTHTVTSKPPVIIPTLTLTPTYLPTSIGGGTGQIAFSSDQTGVMQIYLIRIDGSGLQQITNLPDGACQPTWSPDGRKLAFISPCLRKQDAYWGSKIYSLEIDSNMPPTPMPIPSDAAGDYDPAWSPDGKYIAFTSMRDSRLPHIYLLDLEKEETILLSDMDMRERQPAWSPDGKLIAYIREQNLTQIWLMPPDGINPERFSLSGPINDLYPAWSPDGNFIIFTQMKNDVRIPSLAGMRLQDKNTYNEYTIPLRNQTSIGPISSAKYSPDGYWIVYEGWPDGINHDIFIMTSSGLNPIQLTNYSSMEFSPAWRPLLQP